MFTYTVSEAFRAQAFAKMVRFIGCLVAGAGMCAKGKLLNGILA